MCLNSSSTFMPGTLFHKLLLCLYTEDSMYNGIAFFPVNLLIVLPLCVSVLHLGHKHLRRLSKINHTDAFTYHVSVIQIVGVCASVVSIIGSYLCQDILVFIGIYLFFFNSIAFLLFQCLTCGERYIAVVHPLTYLRLKKQTLARNIICGLVWLHSIVQGFCGGYLKMTVPILFGVYFTLAFIFAYIVFCNISVLAVLLRPLPGDGARKNKSTQKAFYTISTILATLVLKAVGDITSNVIAYAVQSSTGIRCNLWLSVGWFSLPSSVILQILYLHRAGKLPCCQKAPTSTTD